MLKKFLGLLLFAPDIILALLNLVQNWNARREKKESVLKLKVKEVEFYNSYMDIGRVCWPYQSIKKPISVKKGLFSTSIVVGDGKHKRKVYASKMRREEREAVEKMLNTIAEINAHKNNAT